MSILVTPLVDQLIHYNSLPSQYGAKSVSAVVCVGADPLRPQRWGEIGLAPPTTTTA